MQSWNTGVETFGKEDVLGRKFPTSHLMLQLRQNSEDSMVPTFGKPNYYFILKRAPGSLIPDGPIKKHLCPNAWSASQYPNEISS